MKISNVLSTSLVALALGTFASAAQAAPVIQTAGPSTAYICCGDFSDPIMSSITLASGTNTILDLTSTAVTYDQGWGGSDPGSNGVNIYLDVNGTNVWGVHVAGAAHETFDAQTYDLASDPTAFAALNAALAGIDWLSAPTVSFDSHAILNAYPGWELTVTDASFSVTTDTVPAPAALALLGLGLVGVGGLRRKMKKNAA